MDQSYRDFVSSEAGIGDASERSERSEDCRPSSIADRSGGGGGRSFSIERLWDVLDPAAAIL